MYLDFENELVLFCVIIAGLLRVGGDVGPYELVEMAGDVLVKYR